MSVQPRLRRRHRPQRTTTKAVVLADSVSPDGVRLTTMWFVFWAPVLPQMNTHRTLARSSSSMRAVLARKIRRRVIHDPARPVSWGAEQRGMIPAGELSGWRLAAARAVWDGHRWMSIGAHWALERIGLHKQLTNRLLTAHSWQTQIVTATEKAWRHFFAQRCHGDAQDEIIVLARAARDAIEASTPTLLGFDDWHLPLTPADENLTTEMAKLVSMARCARESYGSRGLSIDADLGLAERLLSAWPPHVGPGEHQARPIRYGEPELGPHRGWRCLRHEWWPDMLDDREERHQ